VLHEREQRGLAQMPEGAVRIAVARAVGEAEARTDRRLAGDALLELRHGARTVARLDELPRFGEERDGAIVIALLRVYVCCHRERGDERRGRESAPPLHALAFYRRRSAASRISS